MTTTTTLTKPGAWRIAVSYAIGLSAAILVNLGMKFIFGGAVPLGVEIIIGGVVGGGLTILIVNRCYNRPYQAYQEEKRERLKAEMARQTALSQAAMNADHERMREIEAENTLFGAALRVKKSRKR